MFKKILVPLDGTELSEGVLPYVTQFAKGLNIPMVLLSVIDPDAIELPERFKAVPSPTHVEYAGIAGEASTTTSASEVSARGGAGTRVHEMGGPYASQIFESIEAAVKVHMETIASHLKDEGVDASALVVFGKPAEEIVRVAKKEGCGMVAMATHGRNALGRGMLGSVTDRVMHTIDLPVLALTPEKAEIYEKGGDKVLSKIAIPLDGSRLAEKALLYVEELAKSLSLEVTLVRVININVVASGGMYSYAYTFSNYGDLITEVENEASEYLSGVATKLEAKGLNVKWMILKGHPAVSLVDMAREDTHDLIALTTHGRTGFGRLALGSIAEALVRASGHPVLVIPAKAVESVGNS